MSISPQSYKKPRFRKGEGRDSSLRFEIEDDDDESMNNDGSSKTTQKKVSAGKNPEKDDLLSDKSGD